MKVLVVHDAFTLAAPVKEGEEPKSFVRGDVIKDSADIQSVRDAGQAHFCADRDIPDSFFEPDPASPAKGKPPAA